MKQNKENLQKIKQRLKSNNMLDFSEFNNNELKQLIDDISGRSMQVFLKTAYECDLLEKRDLDCLIVQELIENSVEQELKSRENRKKEKQLKEKIIKTAKTKGLNADHLNNIIEVKFI